MTDPIRKLLLNPIGADFIVRTRVPVGASIPGGTTASLELYNADGTVLTAIAGDLTGTHFEFRVESATSDAWPGRVHYRLYVAFAEEPSDRDSLWYFGDIQRIG